MTLNPRSKLRNVRVELKSAVKITIHFSSSFLPLVHFDIRTPCCFSFVCFAFIVCFYIELHVDSEILKRIRAFLPRQTPGSSRFPICRWQTRRPWGRSCVATCTPVRMCVPEKNVQPMEPRIQTRIHK